MKRNLLLILFIIAMLYLAGCEMDVKKAVGEMSEFSLDDGTRCVAYVIPHNQIRGITCDWSTKP